MIYRDSCPKGQNHQNIHIGIRRGIAIGIGAEQDDPLRLELLDDAVAEVLDGLVGYHGRFQLISVDTLSLLHRTFVFKVCQNYFLKPLLNC
jgi:predicted ATP-grasp superfamily ATP-dependent carboligase